MDPFESYRQFLDEVAQSPEYWAAAAALTFTENLNREMERQAISRAELAKRLGTSRAYVTRVMQGDVNFTLETMVKLALAVGARIDVTLEVASTVETSASQPTAGRSAFSLDWPDFAKGAFLQVERANYAIGTRELTASKAGAGVQNELASIAA